MTEPWPCAVVAPSSLREATHCAGRFNFHAASAVRISSGNGLPLAPKPPPTSSATTLTFSSSISRAPAIASRTPKTFWVEVQTLSPSVSASGVAVTARGSMAAPATRAVVRRIFAVTLSSANAVLMSP